MAFYLYKKEERGIDHKPKGWYQQEKEVELGGKVFSQLWKQHDSPLDKGWHITRDDLINTLTDGKGNSDSYSLIIDWNPKSIKEIGLVEVLDIYAYTYKKSPLENTKPAYTPIMLNLRDIYYKDEFDQAELKKIIEDTKKRFYVEGTEDYLNQEFPEFLYLAGDRGWKFGKVGYVNGAFIYKEAREYFKRSFSSFTDKFYYYYAICHRLTTLPFP